MKNIWTQFSVAVITALLFLAMLALNQWIFSELGFVRRASTGFTCLPVLVYFVPSFCGGGRGQAFVVSMAGPTLLFPG
jgi:hypothetical protein